jgi:hypothetical protein
MQDQPERELYLAIPDETYKGIFSEPIGRTVLENCLVNLIVFNSTQEVIVKWIK